MRTDLRHVRPSAEWRMKIRDFLPILRLTSRQLRGAAVNRISIKFPNGSRIVALSGGHKPTRSHSSVAMVAIWCMMR